MERMGRAMLLREPGGEMISSVLEWDQWLAQVVICILLVQSSHLFYPLSSVFITRHSSPQLLFETATETTSPVPKVKSRGNTSMCSEHSEHVHVISVPSIIFF